MNLDRERVLSPSRKYSLSLFQGQAGSSVLEPVLNIKETHVIKLAYLVSFHNTFPNTEGM